LAGLFDFTAYRQKSAIRSFFSGCMLLFRIFTPDQNIPFMKKFFLVLSMSLLGAEAITAQAQPKTRQQVGYYYSKEDYLNKKFTFNEKETMLPSENYNIGVINYKDKDSVEHKFNCIRAKCWGFRYLDGCDYMYMGDGFFAKIVIVDKRMDLLISPKATYKVDDKGNYIFTAEAGKKVNFYFIKNLDPATVQPFEKQIEDEKALLKEYQADKDNYGEFINKQLTYFRKYNDIVPKPPKGKKK
jgi:hypothetical protein